MATLLLDIRCAWRVLLRSRSATIVSLVALALGVGATSAIFSVVNAVLFVPLPYKEPDRLVVVWQTSAKYDLVPPSLPDYLDWREQSQSLEHMAVFKFQTMNLTAGDMPQRVQGAIASAELFPALGVQPNRGRSFAAEDDRAGSGQVVVISARLWRRNFAGEQEIIGRTITLDGRSFEVVGVMPEDFKFPSAETEVWVPLGLYRDKMMSRDEHPGLLVVARLRSGASFDAARNEMDLIAKRLAGLYPVANGSLGASVVRMQELIVRDIRPALFVLLGAGVFVLLIACANVANLQLSRAVARRREIDVRQALGASRWVIVKQLLIESLMVSLTGGLLGLVLALIGVRLLVAAIPGYLTDYLPSLREVGLDGRMLGFTLAVSFATGVLSGLAPALQAAKPRIAESLKETSSGSVGSPRGRRLRNLIVIGQVAFAVVLVAGAGLMIKTFLRLREVNPGFDAKGLTTLQLSIPSSRYPDDRAVADFYDRVLEKLAGLHSVEATGAIGVLPLTSPPNASAFLIEGEPPSSPGDYSITDYSVVSRGYLQAMNIRLLEGRYLDERDTREAPAAGIISEKMAQHFWPNKSPLNSRIRIGGPAELASAQSDNRWITIVGVAADVKQHGFDSDARPMVYLPYSQKPSRSLAIVLRSATPAETLIPEVRREVLAIDKDQPAYNIKPMDQVISESLSQWRLSTSLLGVFAAVAVILAAVGIYGVMAYSVSQRTREIGIRMALGAHRRDVLAMMLRQALWLTGAGLVTGLAGALLVTRAMAAMLYNTSTTDPANLAGVAALLASVAILATLPPAVRATKVSPMQVLRHE